MTIQPIRLLGIVLSFAVFSVFCWQIAAAQQATPTDKPSEQSTGVRLIDTTPDAGVDSGAASAVRTASNGNVTPPAAAPTSAPPTDPPPPPTAPPTDPPPAPVAPDASLHPLDPSKSLLQSVPDDKAAATPATSDKAQAPADQGKAADQAKTADKAAADGKPAAGQQGKTKLEPIAEQTGPVELEATSFHAVTPGVTTVEQMEKAWGPPKEIRKQNKTVMQLHAVGPFPRVEASCSGGKVVSIIIRFEKSFPANAVAQQLELAKIQPVLVSNELGEILGQAYPERGVLFSFEPSDTPGKPTMKVSHIILEAISAEPFVLRAETNIDSRPDFSLRDLDQALQLQATNSPGALAALPRAGCAGRI